MAKLLYSATMSLDGFIAGAGGDMSWLAYVQHAGSVDVDIDDLVATIGALLIGRRTYGGDDPNQGTDSEGAFGGRWHGRSVVLTHDPPDHEADPDVRFATDLMTAVQWASEAAGGPLRQRARRERREAVPRGRDARRDPGLSSRRCSSATAPASSSTPGGTNVRLEPMEPGDEVPGPGCVTASAGEHGERARRSPSCS